KISSINSFFETRQKRRGFNGTVLYAEKGEILYEKAFGYSNFRKKEPLDITSSFQLASITKPITATAIIMLIERGKLSYEDTIQKFFPEFPYHNITIRNLLTHRSGLPSYMFFADKVWEDKYGAISNDDVIRLMTQHYPERYYLPDVRYNYRNTNYCILASIIEKITGFPYHIFIRSQIFIPLGMDNSSIYNKCSSPVNNHKVIGYDGRWVSDNTYLNGVVGDKGIYASVYDLLKFDQALYTNKLINSENTEESYKPAHRDLRIWDNYGYGWRINASDKNNRIIFHSGWWKGFRTYFVRMIDKHKTLIILSNSTRGSYIYNKELFNLIN
ncbi:serine hydrolase domain-containing protein, partial [Bacteroidota bacterium]